jgi:hypothetical protein
VYLLRRVLSLAEEYTLFSFSKFKFTQKKLHYRYAAAAGRAGIVILRPPFFGSRRIPAVSFRALFWLVNSDFWFLTSDF